MKFTKKYEPVEHSGSHAVYQGVSTSEKNNDGGEDLDFDIFSAPVPETLPRPSWRSRSKAGVRGQNRNDAAVAERDNLKVLRRT